LSSATSAGRAEDDVFRVAVDGNPQFAGRDGSLPMRDSASNSPSAS
jgi:hypothetical protein